MSLAIRGMIGRHQIAIDHDKALPLNFLHAFHDITKRSFGAFDILFPDEYSSLDLRSEGQNNFQIAGQDRPLLFSPWSADYVTERIVMRWSTVSHNNIYHCVGRSGESVGATK